MGQDAALEKGIELGFDERQQARASVRCDLSQEGLEVFPDQLIQGGLFRAPPLVVSVDGDSSGQSNARIRESQFSNEDRICTTFA